MFIAELIFIQNFIIAQILYQQVKQIIIKMAPQPLTVNQQYFRIAYLGFSFMIMFTSFNSLQNMVSKLYEEYGYNNLGQSAILFIYLTFAICTVFTSFIIKNIGFKKAMFLSSLGYAIFQATGLLIVTEIQIPIAVVWICVNLGASITGLSASIIWVAQGSYTSKVASADKKSELFGLFWALMMSSQILGNLLSTFVLGRINNLVYFIILTILGIASSALFLFLPDVEAKSQQETITVKQQINKIWTVIKDGKYKYLNIYFFFPGLTVAFYAGFLYKLVKFSVKQQDGENIDIYNKRLNEAEGYVFITLGLSQLLTGIFMNRFSERFDKFKLATVGTLMVEFAGFMSFVCFYLESYPLCFVCSFLWGSSQTFLQTNTGALISKIFPGRVEGFSIYRIFFALGVVFTLLISILLSKSNPYIFLMIVLVFQTIITGVSMNLRQLDIPSEQNKQKQSLLSQAEKSEQK